VRKRKIVPDFMGPGGITRAHTAFSQCNGIAIDPDYGSRKHHSDYLDDVAVDGIRHIIERHHLTTLGRIVVVVVRIIDVIELTLDVKLDIQGLKVLH
jgi:hypothetical protein